MSICPTCKSTNVENWMEESIYSTGKDHINPISVKFRVKQCLNCWEYLETEKDPVFEEEQKQQKILIIQDLLYHLERRKIKSNDLVRQLNFPPRTLDKWKEGKFVNVDFIYKEFMKNFKTLGDKK